MSSEAAERTLTVRVGGRPRAFGSGAGVTLGRDERSDVVVEHPWVSRRHVSLEPAGEYVIVTDLDSSRGTWVADQRVEGARPFSPPVTLRLGPEGGPEVHVELAQGPSPTTGRQRASHRSLVDVGDTLVIGRGEESDVRLADDLLVSKRHAKLVMEQNGPVVIDLDSRNGTFVNGTRVTRAPLTTRDELTIGRHIFVYRAGMLRPRTESSGIALAARRIGFTLADGRTLLDEVSFTLPRSSLLAVVGPSGSGKSTLLSALTGSQPATTGEVLYQGRDLYTRLEELRGRIGVVPQQDIIHGALTVRQALTAAADLRFPVDLETQAKSQRVQAVLDELNLTEHAETRVSALSGGQRKRASVALELLTMPALLFLDEPTSGLDPGMDEQLMRSLRALADSGRTVIVITHSTASLELCDRLLFLAPGGRTAYFGPPEDALHTLNARDFSKAFAKVEEHADDAVAAFRASSLHRTMVETPLRTLDTHHLSSPGFETPSGEGDRRQTTKSQFRTLVKRQLRIMIADRGLLAFLAAMPIVIALLALIVPGVGGLRDAEPGAPASAQAQQILLVLILGAIFAGLTAGIRDLVGERAIFVRERSAGLHPEAYLAAKAATLGGAAVLQSLVMLALVVAIRGAPGSGALLPGAAGAVIELAFALAATTLCCTLLGLLLSAHLRTSAQAMPLIVVLVMGMLVLSGGLFSLSDRAVLNGISLLSPSRWGYASAAATVDLNSMSVQSDGLWDPSAWSVAKAVLILLVVTMVLAVAARRRLAGRYPER